MSSQSTPYWLIALLCLAGTAAGSDCVQSVCHRDDDGTLWCYNQETPCECATCGRVAINDTEADEVSYSPAPPVETVDGPISCNWGPICAIRHYLPERRPHDVYPGPYGGLTGDGARSDSSLSPTNSDPTRFYRLDF